MTLEMKVISMSLKTIETTTTMKMIMITPPEDLTKTPHPIYYMLEFLSYGYSLAMLWGLVGE
jgi:hypothetical protein